MQDTQKPKRRRMSADAWRQVLARFAASGDTVDGFCRTQGLSVNCFRRWRGRLAVDVPVAEADAAHGKSSGFVELGVIGGQAGGVAASTRVEIRLDLGAGVSLHVVRS